MLRHAPLIAFLPITNFEAARSFYAEALGLEIVHESPFALVLDAAGTSLRLTKLDTLTPQPFTVAGWQVADVSTTIAALSDKGIACIRFDGMDQDEHGAWTAPGGDRVAWFRDPDGNTLSITQFAQ